MRAWMSLFLGIPLLVMVMGMQQHPTVSSTVASMPECADTGGNHLNYTAAGTVGTALTNLQNKTHTHSVTVNALTGGTRKGGTSNPASIIENNNVPTASAGTASTSDVIPYIQLRACSKD